MTVAPEERRRPHPAHAKGTIKLTCLKCQKPFLSIDRACNRRCQNCARHTEGITSNGALGSPWHRGKAGA